MLRGPRQRHARTLAWLALAIAWVVPGAIAHAATPVDAMRVAAGAKTSFVPGKETSFAAGAGTSFTADPATSFAVRAETSFFLEDLARASALVDLEALAATRAPAESLAAFPSPRVRAWQVGLLRPDRLQHAGLSFTVGAALTVAFRDRLPAAGITLALGAGKEWWDARAQRRAGSGKGADAMDLVADAVGLGLALAAVRAR